MFSFGSRVCRATFKIELEKRDEFLKEIAVKITASLELLEGRVQDHHRRYAKLYHCH